MITQSTESPRSRAYHRHQRRRAIQRTVHRFKNILRADINEYPRGFIQVFARTPQRCSCPMCGNWRETEGPTPQEKRDRERSEYEIEEYEREWKHTE